MQNTALLVVDVQQGLIDEHPCRADALLQKIRTLQDHARENGTEVIFIRHNEKDPNGLFAGSPAWQIHGAIAPLQGETIIEKQYSSAFKDTGLHQHLKNKGIQTLVVCGMQTEYCVDATVKSAFEHGYAVYIPQSGTTTFDSRLAPADQLITFYEEDIWNHRFAEVIPMQETLAKLA